MALTLELMLTFLILGLAVALIASLLPFVYVRNLSTAFWVGVLVSLFNVALLWGLHEVGFHIKAASSLSIAQLIITAFSVLIVDNIFSGFRIKYLWGALVFALLVTVVNTGIHYVIDPLI